MKHTVAYCSGSHGEDHEINLETGEVSPPYGDPGWAERFNKVDLVEWELAYGRKMKPGDHLDVLDLAGWWGDEWSEAEDDWRYAWTKDAVDSADAAHFIKTGREAVRAYTEAKRKEAA